MSKFSIIIPAYNVSDYLDECLTSVVNQNFSDFEVIVVDDGSTDNTGAIADRFSEGYKQVKVIHQVNQGLSATRNLGIKASEGDYLIFLDGDDFWSDDHFLSDLNFVIMREEVDVVIFPYTFYYDGTTTKEKLLNTSNLSFDLETNCNELVTKELIVAPAWNKCVNRKLFESTDMYFPQGFISEDCLWCGNLLKSMTSYAILDNPQYMYRQNRQGSLTNQIKKKNIVDILKSIEIGLSDAEIKKLGKEEALEIYYAISFISILPFVSKYKRDSDVEPLLARYKYLLKHSAKLENRFFKYTGLFSRVFGVNLSSAIFERLLGIYKKIK
ncbi:glycosyltransferase family 2 protein [Streptococcus sp. HF-1907]|uniref:glycosyltransferase family 2 protein n=1 Tax=Streptococcus sp. HF-1907 TaxID=2785793 RepID=UPI00189F34F0|nr:glycosyltransferase family 2 protein [Streptococcus sp. HF-1907]MBF7095178.1 glycosyltransferase family 2 protein [Streptococcus sp. HF-1907]